MVGGYRHQNDPLLDMGHQDMGACIHHPQGAQALHHLCVAVSNDCGAHHEVDGHMKNMVLCGGNGHDSPGAGSNLGAWAVNSHHHVEAQVNNGCGRVVILSGNGRHHLPLLDH